MKNGECCKYGLCTAILDSKTAKGYIEVCKLADIGTDLISECPLTFCEFGFSTALLILKHGGKVARSCWERGTYLTIPDTKEKEPARITIVYPYGRAEPWTEPQEAILAEDWRAVQ